MLGLQTELKKYDSLKEGIAQNVGRQEQLLGVLGTQQGAYKSTFGFSEWRQSCEVCCPTDLPMPSYVGFISAHGIECSQIT